MLARPILPKRATLTTPFVSIHSTKIAIRTQRLGRRSQQQGKVRQKDLAQDLPSNPSSLWWRNTSTNLPHLHTSQESPWLLNKPLWVGKLRFIYHQYHHRHHDHVHGHAHTHTPSPPLSFSLFCRSEGGVSHNNDEALLQALSKEGRLDSALDILSRMDTPPSTNTYLSLLKACNKKKALTHAKRVHAHLTWFTVKLTGLLGDYLVMTMANCNAIQDAHLISESLPRLTVFSWTAIISAYVECGCGQEALKMYQCMQEDCVEPNCYTFVSLFKACGSIPDLEQGKKLHGDARRKGFASDVFVGTALLGMYGKCGAVVEAEDVFSSLSQLDVVSWNAMLSAYVELGQGEKALLLYRQIQEEGVSVNQLTVVFALQACGMLANKEETLVAKGQSTKLMSLEIGQALHTDAHRKGYTSDVFVGSALVSMHGKCGTIVEARDLFGALFQPDVVAWNAMLSAYVEWGEGEKALQCYTQMQLEGISPNQLTYVIVIQACGTLVEKKEALIAKGRATKLMCLEIGHALHTDACGKGYTSDVRVGTALVNMYNKCGSILEAKDMFSALSQHDIVSWNAMLTAFVEQGQGETALQLYRQMQEEGRSSNLLTFVIALQACGTLAEKEEAVVVNQRLTKVMSLEIGQALHTDARRKGYALDVLVGNTLVSMYGKSGAIAEAEAVFSALSQRDVVSWNAMLSAYVEQGQGEKVLLVYKQLQEEHITLDDVTLICILQACCETGSMEICKHLHFDIVCTGFDMISFVVATLIHAYGSCASMADAQVVFDELPEPDIVSWNACVAGHAGEGDFIASLHVFEKLKLAGIMPDEVTFSSVLVACTHTGFVVEGLEFFESMSSIYGITPDLTHFGNVADLLGRAGDFRRIENMSGRMPLQSDLSKFVCLLGACRIHGNVALAKQAFDQAVNLQPNQAAVYILMSNIYADFELQECGVEVV